MTTLTVDGQQPELSLFRVSGFRIPPPDVAAHVDDVILSVEFLDGTDGQSSMTYGFSWPLYVPYAEAIDEAIKSQRVYAVDLSRPAAAVLPRKVNDADLDRLLSALQDRQFAPSEAKPS